MPNFFINFTKKIAPFRKIMNSSPFLATIAEAYASTETDLSSHMFVFPGRRAGTFFLKHLLDRSKQKNILLPKVTTMSDFVEKISGRTVAGRIELLFLLYKSYTELLKNSGVDTPPDFDSFRRWGETALSDFNEVDMQDVDPDAIFKNVKDLKEISSNFLTEEQMKVMNEFFGQTFDPQQIATDFWKKFNSDEEHDGALQAKFRLLWQVLAPLYHIFKKKLEESGLTSSGGAYRTAAERLREGWPEDFHINKVVMVGFNALTASERSIFDALSNLATDDDEPFAEFFWDATGPVISQKLSTAGRYVQFNKKRWPMPEWALPLVAKSDVDSMPNDIRVIAVPSNSLQTKVVAEVLSDMSKRIPKSDFKDAKVAVVLPDEQLLIPMLYSIPEGIGDTNLTMGYPLRLSAAYIFVSLLRRVQSTRKKSGNVTGYYFKDLNMLLSHPLSRILFGNGVTKVKEWISKHHRYIIDIADVRDICPEMTSLLRPLDEDSNAKTTADWLDAILQQISSNLQSSDSKSIKTDVDIANIEVYRQSISTMLEAAEEYGIDMNWRTFLTLTDRLLSSETVDFQGQPLKGLQVMGILETRSLDFERIIIPSLNERILPARRRVRTFISDSLRKAYGLPPANYSESLFAYYFFRMITRAKEVVLLYDSRSSEGTKSGDVSRYILQLKYMYARDKMQIDSRTFDLSKSELQPMPIAKTPEIKEVIDSYLDTGKDGKNLSATALTKYTQCQLRFYFEEILKIKTDVESSEFIDAITQGSVIHDVMEAIYLPEDKRKIYLKHPQEITSDLVNARIKDVNNIERLIRRSINTRFYHLPEDQIDRQLQGSSYQVAKILKKQILDILHFDLSQTPFLLFGVEIDGDVSLRMRDGRLINMRFAIDRLDTTTQKEKGVERELMRIVDYKTGSVHANATSIQAITEGEFSAKNLLQLWLYANLFDALPDKNFDKKGPRPVLDLFSDGYREPEDAYALELYEVCKLSSGNRVYPKVDNKEQKDHTGLNAEFLEALEGLLSQLFDMDQPFQPASDQKSCSLCPFKTVCWR